MAKKRKTPSSLHTNEHKQAVVREEAKVLEKEEEEEESSNEEEIGESSSSEEELESESEDGEEEESSSAEEEEEGEDEASKQEALRELLEPFGKSQIIDLLKEAAVKDPKLLPKIVQKADSDPAHRKIFVFGLGWDATAEQLVQAFKSFGEIEESKLITDKNTGRAKGYAFVMFKTRAAAKKALKVPQKRIGNRTVTCQLAAIGASSGTVVAEGGNNRKMYVANVAPHVSFEKLKAFFGRFGEIEEGPLGVDPVTNKFKGFAIITYKSTEGYKKAMEEPIKVVENCQLHCKKFVENFANNSSGQTSNSSVNPAATDVNYSNLGMNTGMLGANLNAGGFLMAQNPGIGLAGNALLAAGYDQAGLAASIFGASLSGNYGINSISPTVMGRYGAQEAYNGLGMYQNSQTGLSSIGTMGTTTTATAVTKVPTSGGSASTTFP
ncbi:UBP1-associated protein 2B-like [Salvia hispanica]|uniref:UBP1-associated protein 2B-like n=1 Tax=Salvia hispanica TaxID=49212 RepID=UPI0020096E9A|nr:UBP1-associated protein 2B-like [Salvia hispanica]XP_047941634.1 UBP1-associated protein 2B-like [Salvia hispanica]XP_047941635.1 UBP1-associated protein 2B-like [Salvia hispanica]